MKTGNRSRITLSIVLALVALFTLAGGAYAAKNGFKAKMRPNVILSLPPGVESDAKGKAEFGLEDDMTMEYKIEVKKIDHITAAHIHQYVGDGMNGPIMVWLYPDPANPGPGVPTGPVKGTLVEGEFNASHLVNGYTWEQVVELLRTGQAYVNVHTSEAPAGEINGHIH